MLLGFRGTTLAQDGRHEGDRLNEEHSQRCRPTVLDADALEALVIDSFLKDSLGVQVHVRHLPLVMLIVRIIMQADEGNDEEDSRDRNVFYQCR